jgi:hypothetical protein
MNSNHGEHLFKDHETDIGSRTPGLINLTSKRTRNYLYYIYAQYCCLHTLHIDRGMTQVRSTIETKYIEQSR